MSTKLAQLYKTFWLERLQGLLHIIHLYKRKGNRTICENHRGICLLSMSRKILARIILNRIPEEVVNSIYPESHSEFRAFCGTQI